MVKGYIIESGTGYHGDNYRVFQIIRGTYHGDWPMVSIHATYEEAVAAGETLPKVAAARF